jgi:hypothetical protein
MMKIALAVAAAAALLTTAPLVTPAKAQGVTMAQVDMQTGRHLDDRDPGYYRERRGYGSSATVGVGPGGVTIRPRQPCRMETTTTEPDDGRRITRRVRRCD